MKNYLVLLAAIIFTSSVINAQPLLDPSVKGKEVGGSYTLLLKPRVGDVFHYKISSKSVVSIKNDDDLLKDMMPDLKATDKASYSLTHYITKTVRAIRADSVVDFLVRIDSIHNTSDDNGVVRSYTSTNAVDRQIQDFYGVAVYAGEDFGLMVDHFGNTKDIYGYYTVVDKLFGNLNDTSQTTENRNSLSNEVYSTLEKLFFHTIPYLPLGPIAKDSETTELYDESRAVWSSLEFPMQKEVKRKVARFEEKAGKTYAVINSDIDFTPKERVLEEDDYHTTLPNYTFTTKSIHYIDVSSGMMLYDKATDDETYAMKIESKLPEKSGKSFATVHHRKGETVVELIR